MRLLRQQYRDRDGKTQRTANWYVEVRSFDNRLRRIPAFTDKNASREFGHRLEKLVEARSSPDALPAEYVRWLDDLPPYLRTMLGEHGILDVRRAGATDLATLFDEFTAALNARERTSSWVRLVVERARVTLTGCGFRTLADIEPGAVEQRLRATRDGELPAPKRAEGARGRPCRKSISVRESNHRLAACKEFVRWAIERRLLSFDPLVSLKPLNARLDPKHVRRALRPEELAKLVDAAHNGPTFRSVSGPARAMAWRLGCEAGLRIGEICALRVGDLELDADGGPMLTVRASVSKNRTEARLPIQAALARDLEPYTLHKLPSASVLALPPSFRHRGTVWLKHDLAAAGIPYADDAGRKCDVHSLRSSFITSLVRSGANVKAVQTLARHASPVETVGLYTRLNATDERDALAGVASVAPKDEPEAQRARAASGGGSVLPRFLPQRAARTLTDVHSTAPSTPLPTPGRPLASEDWRGRRDSNPQLAAPETDIAPVNREGCVDGSTAYAERLTALLTVLDAVEPDLAHVARAWPKLPNALRAAVLAIVRTNASGPDAQP